jgi:hypothetical protein
MVLSPRTTFASVIARPRSLDLAIVIVLVAAACSVGFLMTPVGRLAALDQQVRQLESFGMLVTDERYDQLRRILPYRPAINAAFILLGWPVLWLLTAGWPDARRSHRC